MINQAPVTNGSRVSIATGSRNQLVAAVALIGIGAGTLALRATEATPSAGSWIILALGLAFTAAYAISRQYALMVPGGILTGLGAGIILARQLTVAEDVTAGIVVLGLGLGFLSTWAIGGTPRMAGHRWWPLVPGGILAGVGASLLIGEQAILVLGYWPVLVIGLGLIILGGARFGAGRHTSDAEGH